MAKTPDTIDEPVALVAPLKALVKIVYGDDQHAPAYSFFAPTTQAERDELTAMEPKDTIVSELTDDEAIIADAVLGRTVRVDAQKTDFA